MKLAPLPLVVLLAMVSWASGQAVTSGQWSYIVEDGGATILRSTATGAVEVPSALDGYPVKQVGLGWPPMFGYPNTTVTSVSIPDGVTSIGGGAFLGCTGLTSVTIGNSVTSIGGSAFFKCSGLTSVTIPASVTSIGDYAFEGCSGLTNISVDSSNTNYSSLDGVLFNKGASVLISYPGGRQGPYTIPDSVTSIVGHAFIVCSGLTSVTIPASVTSIGDYAFFGCTALTSIRFQGDMPAAGDAIFNGIDPAGIVYYLVSSSGWGDTYAGWPTQPYSLEPTLTPVVINWPSALPITYGQALSNSVLSGGSADVAGSFGWTTPTTVPPVGTNSYSVTFTPANTDNYQTVSTNVPVVVARYYTQDEYDSFGALQFSNGQRSVTTDPAAFSLYTESQFAANRVAGQADVISDPTAYSLFRESSIMDLRMGGLMIEKQGTDAIIVFQPQTTTDLTQPFTNNGTPVTNTIPMPGNKGFLRIQAR